LRPNARLQQRLQRFHAALRFNSPAIGVHVRHGDACTHAEVSNFKPRCKGWPVYEELVLTAVALYNITNIYLATDDDAIITAARATQDRSGGRLKFIFANMDRDSLFASSWFLEWVKGDV
jgi:hypothetical protein